MPDLLGISHLPPSTADVHRLVTYYPELLVVVLACERAATRSDPGSPSSMSAGTTTADL